jgi:hypothetical protein
MPDNETLTPTEDSAATETPATEGNELGGQDATSPEVVNAPETDYRDRYAASTQEGQRLYQENQTLRNQVVQLAQQQNQLQLQQQQADHTEPEEAPSEDVLTNEEVEDFNQAWLEGKTDKIRQYENLRASRIEKRLESKRKIKDAESNRLQAAVSSLGRIAPELQDQNSPIFRKTNEIYQRLVADPTSQIIHQGSPNYGNYNLGMLRDAALEAKAELGVSANTAKEVVRDASTHFTEPSQRGSAGPTTNHFNPQKHLSAAERDYAMKLGQRDKNYKDEPYKRYWDQLELTYPGMQTARIKVGKPLKHTQI